jgi:hypothetical protein
MTRLHKPGKVHRPAFGIYGIIAGLAIKEALSETIPHIISPTPELSGIVVSNACRLVTFIIVVIRFYLDSVFFFEYAYFDEVISKEYKPSNYTVDFLLGIFHFILFSAWSFTIDAQTKSPILFLVLLAVILLYEFAWYWFTALSGYKTAELRRPWMSLNLFAVAISATIYFPLIIAGVEQASAELSVFLVVLLASGADIVDMIHEGKTFESAPDWFKRFSNKS